VVTLAADSSLALGATGGSPVPRSVPRVVDTTGAGDTFAAGFLREYSSSRRVGESLRRGAREAAESVQRLGAFPWEG
jgi:fructokinase